MQKAATVIRYAVGILFIFSGLVKANDPLGLSYKMQEFFEVWTSDLAVSNFFAKGALISLFEFLHNHTLLLSIVMITLEIVAGVALIVGWQRRWINRLLLVLILFFTFLTAYAYGSGKFKNCGCFGDCLPITPLVSLIKDCVLLLLIAGLFFLPERRKSALQWRSGSTAVLGSLLLALGLQWYVLNYLPLADCLPFKKGANISEGLKIPAGAVPDSFAIRFVYEKGGKLHEFDAAHLPPDLATYTYKDRVDKLVRKGNAEPPIKGFALTGTSGTDSTQAVLAMPKVYLLLTENPERAGGKWVDDFKELSAAATKSGTPLLVATSAPLQGAAQFFAKNGLHQLPLFALDFTAVRTAARANPTLYLLESGTVRGKWSYRQINSVL